MNNGAKAHEKTIKELFIGEMWSYLRGNFHKFSQPNQIKIALELCKKDIPQEVNASVTVTEMPAIQKEFQAISGEANGTPENRIAEYLIGSPPPS